MARFWWRVLWLATWLHRRRMRRLRHKYAIFRWLRRVEKRIEPYRNMTNAELAT
jgi:hypothetical protein